MKLNPLTLALLSALSSSFATQAFAESEDSSSSSLNTVMVTADHTQQTTHAITSNFQVITQEEIESKGYTSLEDALKYEAGFNFVTYGGLGQTTSIHMRGQSNRSTLILVDGVEMTNPMGTGGALLGNLLLSDVARIEIIKGPQSGIWGANASAGVINILTKRAYEPSAKVAIESGSLNTKKLSATLSAASDQADFLFSVSDIQSDGFSAVKAYNGDAEDYESDGFSQTDALFKLGVNFTPEHRLETLVKIASGTTDYDWSNNPDQTDFASVDYRNTLKKIQYRFQQPNFNVDLFLSDNEIEQYYQANITEMGVKGGYAYAPDQLLGFAATHKEFIKRNSSDRYDNQALALSNTNQFADKTWVVTESLRSDRYSDFEDKITGKFGVKHYIQPSIYFSANYGTAYNAPTLFELTYGATADLKPETTNGYDLTVGIDNFSLSFYHTETEDLINYAGFWPNDYYENLDGTSTFEGIEVAYQRDFKTIDTDFSFNYAQGTAKDDNDQWLARRPEQTANIGLSYYGFANLVMDVQTQYVGTMYDLANQGGAQIGDYFVTDLILNYQVNKQLSLYAKAINLFDEDYTRAVAQYVGFDSNNDPEYVYANGGRQYYFGLRGEF